MKVFIGTQDTYDGSEVLFVSSSRVDAKKWLDSMPSDEHTCSFHCHEWDMRPGTPGQYVDSLLRG